MVSESSVENFDHSIRQADYEIEGEDEPEKSLV